ncbi:MAG: NAD(P)/FAD-dependent oxidoreductase [Clostridia bacterium]|nr:NAD(P)/FAD-dependent oxidoreductase [Clostridia bacterium]
MYDLLIIGGGPAALSCGLTARKRGLETVIVSADAGSSWLDRAERLDNYPGLPAVSGRELLRIFRGQASDAGCSFVTGVARQVQSLGPAYFMTLVGNDILESRAVVLAMGAARPKLLPGEEGLLGTGVSWCGTCDGMFYRGREVAVVSSWHGGVEEALFLSGICSGVDYYALAAHELPEKEGIRLKEGRVLGLSRAEDGRSVTVETDQGRAAYAGVFVFRPAVAPDRLLPGLEVDGAFIRVDRRMAASIPGVYACGDCTGQPLQVAKAVGEGNIAAISAAEDLGRAG